MTIPIIYVIILADPKVSQVYTDVLWDLFFAPQPIKLRGRNMNKNIITGFITTLISLSLIQLFGPVSHAAERIADASATIGTISSIESNSMQAEMRVKKLAITKILAKNNSPLVDNVDQFIAVAEKYNLDPYLLPSITWLESSLGTKLIQRTHNPFGWGSGLIAWNSFDEGIETVGRGLRYNYIDRGATDVYAIGRIYAASPTWAVRVEKFMNRFYNEEQSLTKMRNAVSLSESS